MGTSSNERMKEKANTARSTEIPLIDRKPPSRRNPQGAPQCQAIVHDLDGRPRQCRKNARPGFPVCGSHGAGYQKREREGRAKNPALAPLKSGKRAKPETLAQLRAAHPELIDLYEENLADAQLFDLRPTLAQAKALSGFLVEHFIKSDPPCPEDAFRAIQALTQVTKVAQDLLRIERDLGPVSHAELRRLTNGIAETIRHFVPAERQAEALDFLRRRVVPDGGGPGAEL